MSFLVLKPDYPHESASNSVFSVKKGEILECPQGYEPSNSFQVCDSRATAEQYLSLISSQSKAESVLPHKAEEQTGKLLPTPTYPLFRKVASIGDDEPSYQLFSRDIHRFLSQTEAEIIADIHAVNLHHNSAERLLEYERKHFTRKGIIDVLEAIGKGEEKEGEEMKGDVQSGESKEELHV
jgi:hypothetical protein